MFSLPRLLSVGLMMIDVPTGVEAVAAPVQRMQQRLTQGEPSSEPLYPSLLQMSVDIKHASQLSQSGAERLSLLESRATVSGQRLFHSVGLVKMVPEEIMAKTTLEFQLSNGQSGDATGDDVQQKTLTCHRTSLNIVPKTDKAAQSQDPDDEAGAVDFEWVAQAEEGVSCYLAKRGRIMAGTIQLRTPGTTQSSVYELMWVEGEYYRLSELQENAFEEMEKIEKGKGQSVAAPDQGGSAQAGKNGISSAPVLSALETRAEDGSSIYVAVLYTTTAMSFEGSKTAMEAKIALAVSESNTGLSSQNLGTQLVLHSATQVEYTETGDLALDLNRMFTKNDGFFDAEIYAARDKNVYCGADVVVLIVLNTDICGKAYINSGADAAFAAVKLDCMTGALSFPHEIGHVMGCQHDESSTPGYASWARGYNGNAVSGERSIMAYSPGLRINKWSNPDFGGADRDNARVWRERKAAVSNFRLNSMCNGETSQQPQGCATIYFSTDTTQSVCKGEYAVAGLHSGKNFYSNKNGNGYLLYWSTDKGKWYCGQTLGGSTVNMYATSIASTPDQINGLNDKWFYWNAAWLQDDKSEVVCFSCRELTFTANAAQKACSGQFALETVNGHRPAYKNAATNMYLYYKDDFQKWYCSSTLGSTSVLLKVSSAAKNVEDITEGWQYWSGSAWATDNSQGSVCQGHSQEENIETNDANTEPCNSAAQQACAKANKQSCVVGSATCGGCLAGYTADASGSCQVSSSSSGSASFTKNTGKSCQGYANGDSVSRSLEASKSGCAVNSACVAIVCPTGQTASGCTLRSVASLVAYSPEDCYVKTNSPPAADPCTSSVQSSCAASNKQSCQSGSASCGNCLSGFTADSAGKCVASSSSSGQFTKYTGKSCQGYANGDTTARSLDASKAQCALNSACKAIVCPTAQTASGCTLRSVGNLVSYSPEDCYIAASSSPAAMLVLQQNLALAEASS
eukprot:g17223.t1